MEVHNSVFYGLRYTQAWFGFSLGLMGAVLQLIAYFLIVRSPSLHLILFQVILRIYTTDYDSGLLTVTLSTIPTLMLLLKMMAVSFTQLEVHMNSVERLKEYDRLPQEPPAIIPDSRPPEEWPSKGQIDFNDFSFRYREGLPLVLQNVRFFLPCLILDFASHQWRRTGWYRWTNRLREVHVRIFLSVSSFNDWL